MTDNATQDNIIPYLLSYMYAVVHRTESVDFVRTSKFEFVHARTDCPSDSKYSSYLATERENAVKIQDVSGNSSGSGRPQAFASAQNRSTGASPQQAEMRKRLPTQGTPAYR